MWPTKLIVFYYYSTKFGIANFKVHRELLSKNWQNVFSVSIYTQLQEFFSIELVAELKAKSNQEIITNVIMYLGPH